MTRVNVVLLLAVIASALYLVQVQYQSRRLISELERARAEGARLQTKQEQLQVERRAQATPQRVEGLARQQLAMRHASPAVTQYVAAPAGGKQ
ncbi:MAG: cell division protein FtsL [Burkholderiaceae bacterium]|jgi:cell division protein FtsL|nr:cell division protein FtsL [Burkholderiaceae bacterium]